MMHMVSPASAGLFHGAILQSIYQDPFYGQLPRVAFHAFGSDCALNLCAGPLTPQEEYECLMKVDAGKLVNTGACGMQGMPTDGENLVDPIYKSVVTGATGNIPIIVGHNKNEEDYNIMYYDVKEYLEFLLGFIGFTQNQALYDSYPKSKGEVWHGQKLEVVDAMTDFWYTCFCRNIATNHPGNVYRYLFSQHAATVDKAELDLGLNRSYHTLEYAYILDAFDVNQFAPLKPDAKDRATSEIMQGHWLNFITTGKPKSSWPQGNSGNMLEFKIDGTAATVNGANFRKAQCDMIDQARQAFYVR